MAGKRGYVMRRGVMRRETMWISGGIAATTMATASTAVLSGSLNAAALALRPFTVVRVRGMLHSRSDQISADEGYSCSFGLAVVSDQASAIGVTAVPTPDTDRGSDLFFVFEDMIGHFGFTTGTGYRQLGEARGFDSKAMRKVNDDQDVVVTKEATSISNGVILTDVFRMLLKLH